jgi:hypothetical protein
MEVPLSRQSSPWFSLNMNLLLTRTNSTNMQWNNAFKHWIVKMEWETMVRLKCLINYILEYIPILLCLTNRSTILQMKFSKPGTQTIKQPKPIFSTCTTPRHMKFNPMMKISYIFTILMDQYNTSNGQIQLMALEDESLIQLSMKEI